MKVSEIMSEGIISVDVSDTLKTVSKCMKENDIGSLPVFENGAPAGFVTDRDIVLAIADDCTLDEAVSSAMTPEVISVAADEDVTEAARLMEDNQISRIVVMEGTKPVGIVSLQDLTINLENTHLKSEIIEEIKH